MSDRNSKTLWYRRLVMIAAGAVLAGLIVIPAMHLFGNGSAEAPTTKALQALMRPEVPAIENAASWFTAGADAIVWSKENHLVVGTIAVGTYQSWTGEQQQQIRELLALYRGPLETLHHGASLPRSSYGIDYTEGFGLDLPNLLSLIKAARLLSCEAEVAFADGEVEHGLLALATINRMAATLGEESTLITALVSIAIRRFFVVGGLHMVSRDAPWIDDQALDGLQELLPEPSSASMLTRVADAWQAVVLDAMATGRWGEGAEKVEPTRVSEAEISSRVALIRQLAGTVYGTDRERFEALHQVEPDDKTDPVAADLKGFITSIGRAQSVDAQRHLLAAAIAMRKLGLQQGAYPEERPALPELQQPDPFTGNKVSYRRNSNGTLTLALDGAWELLEPLVVPRVEESFTPVTLPVPAV